MGLGERSDGLVGVFPGAGHSRQLSWGTEWPQEGFLVPSCGAVGVPFFRGCGEKGISKF